MQAGEKNLKQMERIWGGKKYISESNFLLLKKKTHKNSAE